MRVALLLGTKIGLILILCNYCEQLTTTSKCMVNMKPSHEYDQVTAPRIEIRAILVPCTSEDETENMNKKVEQVIKEMASEKSTNFKGSEKIETIRYTDVVKCKRKFIITMKINNSGKTKCDQEFIIVDHVFDVMTQQKVRIMNPLVFKIRQEQVLQMYSLHFEHVVNGEATEEVINKQSPNFTGCDASSKNPTCGFAFYKENMVPFSQGFCCSCDNAINAKRQPPCMKQPNTEKTTIWSNTRAHFTSAPTYFNLHADNYTKPVHSGDHGYQDSAKFAEQNSIQSHLATYNQTPEHPKRRKRSAEEYLHTNSQNYEDDAVDDYLLNDAPISNSKASISSSNIKNASYGHYVHEIPSKLLTEVATMKDHVDSIVRLHETDPPSLDDEVLSKQPQNKINNDGYESRGMHLYEGKLSPMLDLHSYDSLNRRILKENSDTLPNIENSYYRNLPMENGSINAYKEGKIYNVNNFTVDGFERRYANVDENKLPLHSKARFPYFDVEYGYDTGLKESTPVYSLLSSGYHQGNKVKSSEDLPHKPEFGWAREQLNFHQDEIVPVTISHDNLLKHTSNGVRSIPFNNVELPLSIRNKQGTLNYTGKVGNRVVPFDAKCNSKCKYLTKDEINSLSPKKRLRSHKDSSQSRWPHNEDKCLCKIPNKSVNEFREEHNGKTGLLITDMSDYDEPDNPVDKSLNNVEYESEDEDPNRNDFTCYTKSITKAETSTEDTVSTTKPSPEGTSLTETKLKHKKKKKLRNCRKRTFWCNPCLLKRARCRLNGDKTPNSYHSLKPLHKPKLYEETESYYSNITGNVCPCCGHQLKEETSTSLVKDVGWKKKHLLKLLHELDEIDNFTMSSSKPHKSSTEHLNEKILFENKIGHAQLPIANVSSDSPDLRTSVETTVSTVINTQSMHPSLQELLIGIENTKYNTKAVPGNDSMLYDASLKVPVANLRAFVGKDFTNSRPIIIRLQAIYSTPEEEIIEEEYGGDYNKRSTESDNVMHKTGKRTSATSVYPYTDDISSTSKPVSSHSSDNTHTESYKNVIPVTNETRRDTSQRISDETTCDISPTTYLLTITRSRTNTVTYKQPTEKRSHEDTSDTPTIVTITDTPTYTTNYKHSTEKDSHAGTSPTTSVLIITDRTTDTASNKHSTDKTIRGIPSMSISILNTFIGSNQTERNYKLRNVVDVANATDNVEIRNTTATIDPIIESKTNSENKLYDNTNVFETHDRVNSQNLTAPNGKVDNSELDLNDMRFSTGNRMLHFIAKSNYRPKLSFGNMNPIDDSRRTDSIAGISKSGETFLGYKDTEHTPEQKYNENYQLRSLTQFEDGILKRGNYISNNRLRDAIEMLKHDNVRERRTEMKKNVYVNGDETGNADAEENEEHSMSNMDTRRRKRSIEGVTEAIKEVKGSNATSSRRIHQIQSGSVYRKPHHPMFHSANKKERSKRTTKTSCTIDSSDITPNECVKDSGRVKLVRHSKKVIRQVLPSGFQVRGGQNCGEKSTPPCGDPKTYHESAHCLRFSDLWYTVYRPDDPVFDHTIYMQLFEKHTLSDGEVYWKDLTKGTVISLGPTNRIAKDTFTYSFTYSSVKNPQVQFALDPDDNRILIPQSVPVNKMAMYPQLQAGANEYLVVKNKDISYNGEDCDKAGVGFEAFVKQPNRCGKPKGTCLNNQPIDFWRMDIEARMHGRKGSFFLENFGQLPLKPVKSNCTTDEISLRMHYEGPHTSIMDVEIKADMNPIIRVGMAVRIANIVVDSTCSEITLLTVMVTNMGLASSSFSVQLADCDVGAPSGWDGQEARNISMPPQTTHDYRLKLRGVPPEAESFHCTINVRNYLHDLVAYRKVQMKRGDRCLCMWHCLCACLSSVTGLQCEPMSTEEYQAAGYRGSMPIITSDNDSFIYSFWMNFLIFGLAMFLVLLCLGCCKGMLGISCCPAVGAWGLGLLVDQARRIPQYYERHLQHRKVYYDEEGYPVHPDTKERSVRTTSRCTELLLNLVFFMVFPIVILLAICRRCLGRSPKYDNDAECGTCYRWMNTVVVGDEMDEDGQGKGSCYCYEEPEDEEDTKEALDEMKRSRESLMGLHRKSKTSQSPNENDRLLNQSHAKSEKQRSGKRR